MFPLLGEVGYCPAQDARGDLQVVAVGAEAASHRAAGRPGQQAGALPRRVQARVVIGSSKGETRNSSPSWRSAGQWHHCRARLRRSPPWKSLVGSPRDTGDDIVRKGPYVGGGNPLRRRHELRPPLLTGLFTCQLAGDDGRYTVAFWSARVPDAGIRGAPEACRLGRAGGLMLTCGRRWAYGRDLSRRSRCWTASESVRRSMACWGICGRGAAGP